MEGAAAHPGAAAVRHVAPGGWRRVATGIAVGLVAGLLVRTTMPAAATDRPTERDGRRG